VSTEERNRAIPDSYEIEFELIPSLITPMTSSFVYSIVDEMMHTVMINDTITLHPSFLLVLQKVFDFISAVSARDASADYRFCDLFAERLPEPNPQQLIQLHSNVMVTPFQIGPLLHRN